MAAALDVVQTQTRRKAASALAVGGDAGGDADTPDVDDRANRLAHDRGPSVRRVPGNAIRSWIVFDVGDIDVFNPLVLCALIVILAASRADDREGDTSAGTLGVLLLFEALSCIKDIKGSGLWPSCLQLIWGTCDSVAPSWSVECVPLEAQPCASELAFALEWCALDFQSDCRKREEIER